MSRRYGREASKPSRVITATLDPRRRGWLEAKAITWKNLTLALATWLQAAARLRFLHTKLEEESEHEDRFDRHRLQRLRQGLRVLAGRASLRASPSRQTRRLRAPWRPFRKRPECWREQKAQVHRGQDSRPYGSLYR